MTTDDLYDLAEDCGHEVFRFALPQCQSICVEDEGAYYIGLDNSLRGIAEKEHLCHEIAHANYAGVYCRHAPLNTTGRIERSANKWTFLKLIPAGELREVVKRGFSVWEIADYFDVTYDMLCKAVEYYTGACGLNFEVAT